MFAPVALNLNTSFSLAAARGPAMARRPEVSIRDANLESKETFQAAKIERPTLATLVSNLFASVAGQPALAKVAAVSAARINESIDSRS